MGSRERPTEGRSLATIQKVMIVQWSKLKTRLGALIDPGIRKRVDFHLTQHRKHYDEVSQRICTCGNAPREIWITVDKLKVFSANYSEYQMEEFVFHWNNGVGHEEARHILACREIHDYQEVGDSLRAYLDLDPHEALRSQDPILKALAIIDRRIGKRTLRSLVVGEDEHSLVRLLYCLRCPTTRGGARVRIPN